MRKPTVLIEAQREVHNSSPGHCDEMKDCGVRSCRLAAELEAMEKREPAKLSDERKYQTLCPEHGWGVAVDEDGCCGGCGCVAFGPGVDEAAAQIRALQEVATTARALIEACDHEKEEESATEMHDPDCDVCKVVEPCRAALARADEGK